MPATEAPALCRYPYPVIVVPGITGTDLVDQYPLPPETIWNPLIKEFERSAPHPDNLMYEAAEPSRVAPSQIFAIAYRELVEELRYNLRPAADQPVPVYPFGYDWRRPLETIEDQLADFVEEVIERTQLLRHYHEGGYLDDARVNLVGHSLGGIIIAGYLARNSALARVNKVVTLGTPYQGSFEAVLKVTTGTASLGAPAPSSREREGARLTPSLYYLVPTLADGLTVDPGLPASLYDPRAWQPSVVGSIAEFIRTRGIVPPRDAQQLFSHLLAQGQAHYRMLQDFRLEQAGLDPSRWLAIAGADEVTRVHLKVVLRGGLPDFVFSSDDRQNLWGDADPVRARITGDGTVPLESAVPPFLNAANLVVVTSKDFGYWELADQALMQFAGLHAMLPTMDMLQRLTVRFFTGQPDVHQNTWGRRYPGAAAWQPPLPVMEK
jgi:pimeloyl-ACP methyl ester carboxylesterase